MQWIRDIWMRFGGAREEPPVAHPSRLIVGLGNPGPKYLGTRHNIGFRILECVADRAGAAWLLVSDLEARVAEVELAGQSCLLIEPQTFMNNSGRSVVEALAAWPDLDPATDLLVVFDDMDLPTGRIRLRPSGGGGGHRGIGDILNELDSKAIPRLRFGIGHPGAGGAVLDWVLARFEEDEERVLATAVERAADAVEATVREGVPGAMGQFNALS